MKESTKLCTARILRDHPELRTVDKREELIMKVQAEYGLQHKPMTIDRMARHLQNTMKMYQVEDDRFIREDNWREYFSSQKT